MGLWLIIKGDGGDAHLEEAVFAVFNSLNECFLIFVCYKTFKLNSSDISSLSTRSISLTRVFSLSLSLSQLNN